MDMITKFVMEHLVETTSGFVMPLMLMAFVFGIFVRVLMFYCARVQNTISLEFEKRVRVAIDEVGSGDRSEEKSFQVFVLRILERTYYECFELRSLYKRRNFDHVTSLADRLFLTQEGAKRVVIDTGRLIRYLKRENTGQQQMMEISRNVFDSNPFFNKLIGIFPMSLLNELTNILPGLFIIGGIFGTFLGISKGLPELGAMDLLHLDEAKHVMDGFLGSISQAMVKSIVGIFLSVTMSLVNTFFAAETLYYNSIRRFSSVLELLWNETSTNTVSEVTSSPAGIQPIPGREIA